MRFPLRLKIALLTATLSAVPLVVLGWLLIDVNAREVESSSQALQIALVEQVATRLDEEVAGRGRALAVVAEALADEGAPEDVRVGTSLRLLDAQPGLDVVAVYGASGALIDRLRDPRIAAPETPDRLDAALRAAADGGRAIGPITRDGDSARVLLVVPVRAGGRVTGYAASPWSLADTQRSLERLSRAQLASREGVLLVLDADRRALVHPDPAAVLAPVAPVAMPPDADVEALAQAPASAEREDAAGRRWLSTAVGLSELPWAVVAMIPTDVAYASLAQMQRIVIASIALTVLLALVAAFVFARRIAAPIGELVAFTEDLAARRFDRRVEVRTRDELAVLGEALSGAAAQLEASEARLVEEAAIRGDLRRYLPGELVEKIVRREQSMELGGQRREITVLFADVVAFTPLSERLPPEQVVAILNELFTLLTEAVFRHGGTVDKFLGDCVMALFGAPAAQEDHAARALYASQDMLRFLESANAGWRDRYGVEVQLAIGVNSGEAVVGNVGSETRMEYTAIGDVVNVAARLETIARPSQILVSHATVEAAGEDFDARAVGEREVPGRAAPVALYEVDW